MDEAGFLSLANATRADMMERLDAAVGDVMDIDLQDGVLTIEIDDGCQYVVNKQAPMQQIWVSSPVSGAGHFDYDRDREAWINSRSGAELINLLAEEISSAAGQPSGLEPSESERGHT